MRTGLVRHFLSLFISFGAFGLIILGILDSSFFFLPFGNDLLLVILVARDHSRAPLYAAAATAGSVVGVFLLNLVMRKEGEEGLERLVSPKRLESLKARARRRAGVMFALRPIFARPQTSLSSRWEGTES